MIEQKLSAYATNIMNQIKLVVLDMFNACGYTGEYPTISLEDIEDQVIESIQIDRKRDMGLAYALLDQHIRLLVHDGLLEWVVGTDELISTTQQII
jgi:hypothetical protein